VTVQCGKCLFSVLSLITFYNLPTLGSAEWYDDFINDESRNMWKEVAMVYIKVLCCNLAGVTQDS
jgi:hypothetical protein